MKFHKIYYILWRIFASYAMSCYTGGRRSYGSGYRNDDRWVQAIGFTEAKQNKNMLRHFHRSFCVCAQPLRDGVTVLRHLLLARRIRGMIPAFIWSLDSVFLKKKRGKKVLYEKHFIVIEMLISMVSNDTFMF